MNNRCPLLLLWAIVALVSLLSILQPVQMLTMSFMAVPFVMLYVTQTKQKFALITIAILSVLYLAKGNMGMYAVMISLYFIIPAIVIGQLFKSGKPALHVFVVGTVTFLIELLVLFITATSVLDFDAYEYVMKMLNDEMSGMEQSFLFLTQVTMEMKQQFALLMSKMVPFIMIISALYMGTITYAISCRLIAAQGYQIQRLEPVRDWMLPKSLISYYVIVSIIDFVGTKSMDSFFTVILLNLRPLLQLAFVLQGFAFLFFYAHAKNWGRVLPVIITIATPFYPFLPIVGFLDLMLPVRKFLSKPKV